MRRLIFGTLVLILVLPSLVVGGKPDKGKGKKKGDKAQQGTVTIAFSIQEQEVVRGYFTQTHGKGKCPPGLAKKNNGCLPPGQAKKRYVVGHPLPPSIEVVPLPRDLEVRIGPPPSGHRYAIVDGDLVKLVVGTLLVVDAIDGLVN